MNRFVFRYWFVVWFERICVAICGAAILWIVSILIGCHAHLHLYEKHFHNDGQKTKTREGEVFDPASELIKGILDVRSTEKHEDP